MSRRSISTPASYVGSDSANAEEYTAEDGERRATGAARDVAHGTLDDHAGSTVVGSVGDPVGEILAEADGRSARPLVVKGRKRTPVGKAVFGSTT